MYTITITEIIQIHMLYWQLWKRVCRLWVLSVDKSLEAVLISMRESLSD